MSDKILERIAVALEAIASGGAKIGGGAAGAATRIAAPPAAGTAAAKPAAAPGTAAKPAAAPGTAAKAPGTATKPPAGKPAAAGAAPAANAKGPGGKYTNQQVRDIITQVATNPNLGKQEALSILDEEGGVQNVSSLKPENFDKVYEACQVALNGVAGAGGAAEEVSDDPLA